ncbi:dipeptidase [Clostridiaceae bacterium HSG29]|nr:dipeptidase [Clostridiaceae bacterium HSG29]
MKMIDLHCDTISVLEKLGNGVNLKKNNFHVDIEKLKMNGSIAQFFALFVKLDEYDNPWNHFENLYDRFKKEIEENKNEIIHVKSFEEMKNNKKISAFLTVEEGGIIGNDLNRLNQLYELGIRLITLTWNFKNSIGHPNLKGFYDKGLTDFGKNVIEIMNDKGIIVDVSHLSDKGFYDVIEISKKPFIASHSNAREIANNPRNLTDDMLKILGNKGGITGLNFCPPFININEISSIEYMIKHINHIVNHAGIESMAIGTDFDGISGNLEIADISKMYLLKDRLVKEGYSEEKIDKIWYKNAERVIKEIL